MAKLILHVGPGKCGSSSIQKFFAQHKKTCRQKTHFKLLTPKEIEGLSREYPCGNTVDRFAKFLSGNRRCDAIIVSHESLFHSPLAVRNICNLSRNLMDKKLIVGYSRRQSERFVSAYSQWVFRSSDRIKDRNQVLHKFDLNLALFSGLERHLIASIANDFYSAKQVYEHHICDWFHSYKSLSRFVSDPEAEIKCGILPSRISNVSLIEDFCDKCGLTLRDEVKDASRCMVNLKFDQDLVEAVDNAVELGFDMPGPHMSNRALQMLSDKIVKRSKGTSEFLANLKAYIDHYFYESNLRLCREYNLNEAYFTPPARFSKAEILDIIMREGRHRAMNSCKIIEDYRELSAKMVDLCFKLIKNK